jgi:hypothetical protein
VNIKQQIRLKALAKPKHQPIDDLFGHWLPVSQSAEQGHDQGLIKPS